MTFLRHTLVVSPVPSLNERGMSLIATLGAMAISSIVIAALYQTIGNSMSIHRDLLARADYEDALAELKILMKNEANCQALFGGLSLDPAKPSLQSLDILNKILPGAPKKFTDTSFGLVQFERKVNVEVIDSTATSADARVTLLPHVNGGNVPMRPRPLFLKMALNHGVITVCSSNMDDVDLSEILLGRTGDAGFIVPHAAADEQYLATITLNNLHMPGVHVTRGGGDDGGGAIKTPIVDTYSMHLRASDGGHVPIREEMSVSPLIRTDPPTSALKDIVYTTLSGGMTHEWASVSLTARMPLGFSGQVQPVFYMKGGAPILSTGGGLVRGTNISDRSLPYTVRLVKVSKPEVKYLNGLHSP
jgi:hypothetical protein